MPDWTAVERLYEAAAALPHDERGAFLDAACSADPDLRREVEGLLAHERGPSFLSLPAGMAAGEVADTAYPTSSFNPRLVGARLGGYDIEGLLGAGGMGEVYRGRDRRLGRAVAIKILPPRFAADRDRLARLEREARLLAAVNHPNIAVVHGIEDCEAPAGGSSGRIRAIVMELVEGETLADRLAATHGRRLPRDVALRVAHEIALALEAAHEKGIVHRDLKPANIKIAPDGTAKVLDFGLAKPVPVSAAASSSPDAVAATEDGLVLGTPAYMSPEQARARPVDKRTDIWAFGVVLFEMLTGLSPFARNTASETIAAVLEREPEWARLPADVSPALERLLRRCLTKDVRLRLRDAGDAALEIRDLLDASPGTATYEQGRGTWREGRTLTAIAVGIVAVTIGVSLWRARSDPAAAVTYLALTAPAGHVPEPLAGIALSPDGRQVAFVAGAERQHPQLFVRSLDEQTATPIAGSDEAAFPFFSPDGRRVAFFAGGQLKVATIGGGSNAQALAPATSNGGSWGSDDTLFFTSPAGGIWRIAATGGQPHRVTTIRRDAGEVSHWAPRVLPGGQALLYSVWKGPGWDERQIVVQRLETGERHTLVGGATARYANSGHLVYTREGRVMAAPFDLDRLRSWGCPLS